MEIELRDISRYELELEINDFPQTARWRVTSREALNRISEFSEAGITVRGNYIPPGKASSNPHRRACPSVRWLVRWSVTLSLECMEFLCHHVVLAFGR